MCGIGGVFGFRDADQTRAILLGLNRSLRHRGPDDEGVFVYESDPAGGLSACRLAIQDTSNAGHQPMWSEDGHSVGVLNGEIYNVGALRQELVGLGHAFRGSSDTEVLVNAYQEWGTECVERLRGMFALAVFEPGEGTVLLARDRIGIKPLYYRATTTQLLFASELRAMASTRLVDLELSSAAIESFLGFGSVGEPESMISEIEMVPPGQTITWRPGRLDARHYWRLEDAFGSSKLPLSHTSAPEDLRAKLEETVSKHLVSDVPLGVFLSGGLDSSALVGLVSRVSDTPPVTVSVDFGEREFSEREYMQLVASRFGTRHVEVPLRSADLLAMLPRALDAMDQPTIDGMNTYVVSAGARAAELTVALSGLGGDELFGGYETFRHLLALRFVHRVPAPIRAASARIGSAVLPHSDRSDKVAQWLRSKSPSATLLYRELFSAPMRRRLSPDLKPEIDGHAIVGGGMDPFNEVSFLELQGYMRNTLLRDADVFSMAHGLEVRVPFLDHEVVEFVASLPGASKSGPPAKSLLVAAVRDLIPRQVIKRRKMGFNLPFDQWMRNDLRELMIETLLNPSTGGPISSLLNQREVVNVWQAFIAGRTGWARPWALFVLKTWGQRLAELTATARSPAPTARP